MLRTKAYRRPNTLTGPRANLGAASLNVSSDQSNPPLIKHGYHFEAAAVPPHPPANCCRKGPLDMCRFRVTLQFPDGTAGVRIISGTAMTTDDHWLRVLRDIKEGVFLRADQVCTRGRAGRGRIGPTSSC